MAGPLSGIAGQQHAPIAQQTQTNQNQNTNQVREQADRQPQNNQVQPQGAPAAESQNTETGNQDALQQRVEQLLTAQADSGADQPRGSVIDITI